MPYSWVDPESFLLGLCVGAWVVLGVGFAASRWRWSISRSTRRHRR